MRRSIFSAHIIAAIWAGMAVGALLGVPAAYLATPVSFLFEVANEVFVTAVYERFSPALAANLGVPFAFFALHFMAGLAGGFLSGVGGGVLFAALGRSRRGLWGAYFGLQLAVWAFLYLLLWVLHIKFAPGLERAAIAGAAAAAALCGVVAWLVAKILVAGAARVGATGSRFSRWLRIVTGAAALFVMAGLLIGAARHFGREADPEPGARARSYPVLLIGLDGVTWSIAKPLIDEGLMPNLARLMEEGVSGSLRTMLPPIESPTVWTSIATGKRPDKHGIQGFVVVSEETHQVTPVTSDLRRATPFWHVLTDAGLAVDVVCWYVSWPAEDVSGAFVSERLLFPDLERIVSPEAWEVAIAAHHQAYLAARDQELARFTPHPYRPGDGPFDENSRAFLEQQHLSILEYTHRKDTVTFGIARDLLRRGQPDVFAVYFEGIDRVSHRFLIHELARRNPSLWKRLYPSVDDEEMEKFGSVMRNYHMQVDEWLGGLLELVDERTAVIVVSDHGFGIRKPYKVHLEMDPLLEFLGYLQRRTPGERRIDWSGTRLYDAYRKTKQLGRIAVNVAGREENGVVARSDVDGLVREARDRLAVLETTAGRRAFASVKLLGKPGESGSAGEIEVVFNESCLADTLVYEGRRLPASAFIRAEWMPGNHRIDGILVARGGPFRRGASIHGAGILDVAPTLLKIAGVAPARDMDGRPLDRAFEPELGRRLVSGMVGTYQGSDGPRGAARSTSADSLLLHQLKSLGYIR